MKRLLILLLLCTVSASAQTTTVTGTITDPQGNPYQNGTASAQKVVSSGQNPGPSLNTATNAAGLFSFSGLLALPSPASYIFTICAAPVALGPKANPTPVQQCFANTVPIAISGASQDVSVTLNALAPTLGPQVSNITGNALTATSLQNAPAQCAASSLATGITASGTANCTNSPAVTNLTVSGTGTFAGLAGCQHVNANQTFAAALAAAGSPGCIVVDQGTFTVSANATIASGVHFVSQSGGLLSPNTGITLTINGTIDAPKSRQIFTGLGTVQINQPTQYAPWFAGATADVQLNNCNTSVVNYGGGTCDATGYPTVSTSPQTIAATVVVGQAVASPGISVTLLIDRSTWWNITITNGTDAIQIYSHSSIVALGSANPTCTGANVCAGFQLSSTASVNHVIATYPRANGQTTSWVGNIDGVVLLGNATATVTQSMMDIVQVTDTSSVHNPLIANFFNTIGLRIGNTGNTLGGVDHLNLYGVDIDGMGNTGARPVVIDGTQTGYMRGITFHGGVITHPGATANANIEIQGANGATLNVTGVEFLGTQLELMNSVDGILINNGTGIAIEGMTFTKRTPGTTVNCIRITSGGGAFVSNLTFQNVSGLGNCTNTINDAVNTKLWTTQYIGSYVFAGSGTGEVIVAKNGNASVFAVETDLANPQINFTANILPLNDNLFTLGGASNRMSGVFSTSYSATNLLISGTAPTIAAAGCGGAAASIVVSNGTAAFKVNVGTTPTSACTITMPTAATGWNCFATDITTNSTSVFLQKQTGAESTTQVVITNFNDVAVATAFVASDILKVACSAD